MEAFPDDHNAVKNDLREGAAKDKAEADEQRLILEQTQESNEKLRERIRAMEEERERLLERIGGGGDG